MCNMLGTSKRGLELVGGVRKTGAAVAYLNIYIYIYIYIQVVPGGMCQTLGGCSLC